MVWPPILTTAIPVEAIFKYTISQLWNQYSRAWSRYDFPVPPGPVTKNRAPWYRRSPLIAVVMILKALYWSDVRSKILKSEGDEICMQFICCSCLHTISIWEPLTVDNTYWTNSRYRVEIVVLIELCLVECKVRASWKAREKALIKCSQYVVHPPSNLFSLRQDWLSNSWW